MANIRIYTGDAIGQNTLSADWLNRRRPPEPKVVGSTPASRTIWGFGLSLQNTQPNQWGMDNPLFQSAWVTSSEFGSNHRPNQNKNQNNGEDLMEMGERRSGLGFSGVVGFHYGVGGGNAPKTVLAQGPDLLTMDGSTVLDGQNR